MNSAAELAAMPVPTFRLPVSSSSLPTRRAFLETAGGVVLAATLADLAQAAELTPVRVAVIGTGARGSDLLRNLTTIHGCHVVALADDYPPHLEKAAKYAGEQVRCYTDYRQMLEEQKPQAVIIAVPLVLHFAIARDCLQAGVDVFCEKTMCYSIAEARQLVQLVTDTKRVFQVGLQRRANPIYQQAVAMVQAGLLGQITAIKSQWHRNNNWRRPIPVPQGNPRWSELEHRLNWRLYRNASQGLMAELGSHQMDVANWLLGTTPKRVLASGGIDYWRDGREVFDNVFCVYDYEVPCREPAPVGAGISATAKSNVPRPAPQEVDKGTYKVRVTYSSLCNNAYEGAAELIEGTRGTLYLTSTKGLFYREQLPEDTVWLKAAAGDPNAAVLTAGKTLKLSNSPWAHRGEPIEIDFLSADDTRDELVSFVDHVRKQDRQTLCDVHEGYRDTATVLMANAALEGGGVAEYEKWA